MASRAGGGIIFANGLRQGELPSADKSYLGQLVVAQTGRDQSQADKRVSDTVASAQQHAEAARKASAHTLLCENETKATSTIGGPCSPRRRRAESKRLNDDKRHARKCTG